MAIVIIKASKATPGKALDYITDKGKAATISCRNIAPNQPLAQQMMTTAKLWGKAQGENDRKYYHLKISFDPKDWTKNGGTLTERGALQIGMAIMREFCPTSESVGSVHVDRGHLHFHGVINAVDLQTGKMLDMRNADYRRLKDRVQEICAEKGLNAMDWRKATTEKRQREAQAAEPIKETFAEKGLKARGKTTWKDELRNIIDQAAASCRSMDEFREQLQANGVALTRCTEQTISYKLGDHRACRGDTLGGGYTRAAIANAIEHNQDISAIHKYQLQSIIADAEKKSEVQRQEERAWALHQEQIAAERQREYSLKFYLPSIHKPGELKMYDKNGKKLSTAVLLYRLGAIITRNEKDEWFYQAPPPPPPLTNQQFKEKYGFELSEKMDMTKAKAFFNENFTLEDLEEQRGKDFWDDFWRHYEKCPNSITPEQQQHLER